jgi:hypothetical protein
MAVAEALKQSGEMRETRSELAVHAAFWLAGLILVGVLLPGISDIVVRAMVPRPSTQRVVVAYPEQWNRGDYRNCSTSPEDVVHHLPILDCDLETRETPRSRMFVMDVKFFGTTPDDHVQPWTCQQDEKSLICRN